MRPAYSGAPEHPSQKTPEHPSQKWVSDAHRRLEALGLQALLIAARTTESHTERMLFGIRCVVTAPIGVKGCSSFGAIDPVGPPSRECPTALSVT